MTRMDSEVRLSLWQKDQQIKQALLMMPKWSYTWQIQEVLREHGVRDDGILLSKARRYVRQNGINRSPK